MESISRRYGTYNHVMRNNRTLDIAPLRSFVAVADCGGFQRAATSLHLSQGAVSQHVRRLESAVGHPRVERSGRGSRFTTAGEQLLHHARRVLAVHDEALHDVVGASRETLVVGSTEHAAAQVLPPFAQALEQSFPDRTVQFRIDRGAALRESLATGRVSLALLLGPAHDSRATPVGELELTWYAAPGWVRQPGPLPVVAFDNPCVLRSRALETLARHHIPALVGAEASNLAGVHAAVAAGLGVALMATLGHTPVGLAVRDDLPAAPPLPLAVWATQGLDPAISHGAVEALRPVLNPSPVAELAVPRGA